MISIDTLKSNWYVIIFISAIFYLQQQIWHHSDGHENADLLSAIKRTKSATCKEELQTFGSWLEQTKIYRSPARLARTCKLDRTDVARVETIGCLKNTSNHILLVDQETELASDCLDLCFSYSHSHGGLQKSTNQCFCGDHKSLSQVYHDGECNKQDEIQWSVVNRGIYQPNGTFINQSTIYGTRPRIAFLLILKGRQESQVVRFIKNFWSNHHLYFIHVDKRDDYLHARLLLLAHFNKNVIVTDDRFNTIWGGPSLLTMIMSALEKLSNHKWDYLINLSESDFHLKPLTSLETYLARQPGAIYLRAHNLKGYNFIKKQGLDRNFYQCDNRVWRVGKRRLPPGLIYSGGSDWFALPREFCAYIQRNYLDPNSLVGSLGQLYNFTLLPAESFFHTIAINSEFCDKYIDANLRVVNWQRKHRCKCQHTDVVDWCGCSPVVYQHHDLHRLLQSNESSSTFFARKFDPTISSSIIDTIEHLLTHETIKQQPDARYWMNIYSDSEDLTGSSSLQAIRQVGHLSLLQIENKLDVTELVLRSASAYFNHDKFIGILYKFCDKIICHEFLVERNSSINPCTKNATCLEAGSISLQYVEVNHGFDPGERIFRDAAPMDSNSKVVVYHEWLIGPTSKLLKDLPDSFQFVLKDEKGDVRMVQDVKPKRGPKSRRLSLAHRLTGPVTLYPGLWTLVITQEGLEGVSHEFLVFDGEDLEKSSISRAMFDRHFLVTAVCTEAPSKLRENRTSNCYDREWSSVNNINIL